MSNALTAGSMSAGACVVRRSSRRTAAASAGTGDCTPATESCASRKSPHLLDLHHGRAPLGQHGLFRRLRAELAQLVDRMAQPVGFALRALDVGAMRGKFLLAA